VGLLAALLAPAALPGTIDLGKLKRLRPIVDAIYRMDYPGAEALSRRLIQESPDDPAGYVFLARTYWARELNRQHALSMDRFAAPDFFQESKDYKYKLTVDPAAEQAFDAVTAQAIGKAKALMKANPHAGGFLLGLAYSNQATFDASLTGSWWSAFRTGQKAVHLHRQVRASNPDLADPLLAIGTYDYVAASVPWTVRWLGLLIGAGLGSKERGKQQIETAASKAVLVAEDADVLLSLIYTRERDYGRAYAKVTALGQRYPQNYLLQLDRAGLARRMGQPELAVQILSGILRKIETGEDGYLRLERAVVHNRLGLTFRSARDLRTAETWFRRVLADQGASPQPRIVAHLELGKTLDLANRRGEAMAHYRAVAESENVHGSRQEAERLLKTAYREETVPASSPGPPR
jgi:hypothetical protein